ncbi:MAG: bifunctional adenosylcobinamide kinase/adenosylcobinamide-phosphate guanylyltransferase [Lachnospiraceae bacterium]|nr:bifunctional adenosylcobinamide kinase/adenosylcobinamide-phosphate guanylyltransferase [Lachnospiraceae bacterium]
MILIVGGYSQGKLAFAKDKFKVDEKSIYDAEFPEEKINGKSVINNFNKWVKAYGKEQSETVSRIEEYIMLNPDCIIISDEIGNGIVPIGEEEREFRERLGRIQIELAKKAKEVYRITCGIGWKIK